MMVQMKNQTMFETNVSANENKVFEAYIKYIF